MTKKQKFLENACAIFLAEFAQISTITHQVIEVEQWFSNVFLAAPLEKFPRLLMHQQ